MSILEDIGAWLEQKAIIGDEVGWPWWIGLVPATQEGIVSDQAIALSEIPAGAAPVTRSPEPRGLQVRIRGIKDDYLGPQAKLRDIHAVLHRRTLKVGNTDARWIESQTASPIPWGLDHAGRWEFSWNFTVWASPK